MNDRPVHIHVDDLTMAYGANLIQADLNFDIYRGDVFVIIDVMATDVLRC